MQNEKQTGEWRSELRSFFDEIRREDDALSNNIESVARYYANTALPALEAVAKELSNYDRECETGLDTGRVFIIVKNSNGNVEFQYAVVVEVRIEGVRPFAHCWFEEQKVKATGSQQIDEGKKEISEGNDEGKGDDKAGEDKEKNGKNKSESKDDPDSEDDKDKPSKLGKRTKTIEALSGWTDAKGLETVTREMIVSDFTVHYEEAVKRLRIPLHEVSVAGPQDGVNNA